MTQPGIGSAAGGQRSSNTDPNSAENYTTFDPMFQPDQKTLVYSPQVRILIARGNKQYDVSKDVTRGGIIRRENAASSLAFSLANKDTRYNGTFHRMDRVVVFLKRISWVQVFSGYLDSVPYQQLYGGEVNFRATCTLKRIMHTWWDPNLPDSVAIFQASRMDSVVGGDGQSVLDSGSGSLIRRLLTAVGGWNNANVHVQNFPLEFLTFMQQNLSQKEGESRAAFERYKQIFLGAGDTSIGVGEAAAQAPGISMGTFSIGQPFYIAEIIKAADAAGAGPVTSDILRAQEFQRAAEAGSSSFMEQSDHGWQESQRIADNWQTMARNSDGAILGVACGLAESGLRVLANAAVPDSFNFPNDGTGTDHDSIGIFQQRNNGAWGTTAQRMNPRASADMFFKKLVSTQWRNKDPGQAIFDVQIGGSPSYYSSFIPQATTLVQAARGNSVNTPLPPSIGTPLGNIGLGTNQPMTPAGVTSAVQSAAGNVPSQGGLGPGNTAPGAALLGAENEALGKPEHDTARAVNWAVANAGLVSYSYGGNGFPFIDCSQFTQLAYRSIGIELNRSSGAQAAQGIPVPATALRPGDLLANDSHVQMYIGGGMIVSNGGPTGTPAKIRPLYPGETSEYQLVRIPGTDYGGPTVGFNDALAVGPGAAPGTTGNSVRGTGSTGSTEPIARNLFTYSFLPSVFAPKINSLFSGEKSFIYAQPLIQSIQATCRGSLRNFASAPNGDFVAYYPDHFGIDGKPAVLQLEDIECKNVKIDFSDDSLATHVYVAGSESIYNPGITPAGWIMTQGVATVEDEWLFQRMSRVAAGRMEAMDGQSIMRIFGPRPMTQEFPEIVGGPMEKMLAISLFMQKWAEQYNTQVEFTFMPELFPGMRISLSGNLQVYVTQVEHTWDFENGFNTTAIINAPSNSNVKKLLSDPGEDTNSPPDFLFGGGD